MDAEDLAMAWLAKGVRYDASRVSEGHVEVRIDDAEQRETARDVAEQLMPGRVAVQGALVVVALS